MDLKVLFHNPEQLSDDELMLAREKIRFQRSMPWLAAVFGGFSVYVLERAVMRRHKATIPYLAVGALAGFWLGNASNQGHQLLPTDKERA